MSRGLSYQQIFTLRYIAACNDRCECLVRLYEAWGQHLHTDDDPENGVKAGDLNKNFASASFALSIRGLERRGLITRETLERDRRRTCLVLTESGKQKADDYHNIRFGEDVDRRLERTALRHRREEPHRDNSRPNNGHKVDSSHATIERSSRC